MAVCPSTEVGSVPTAPVPVTTCHLLLCHPLAPHRQDTSQAMSKRTSLGAVL